MSMPQRRDLYLTTYDGLRLHAVTWGSGPLHWLVPPGLGTPPETWIALAQELGEQVTLATWSLRGCYGSEAPVGGSGWEVPDHARDGLSVLAALGWQNQPIVLGGWSLGVQISLELYKVLAPHVLRLVLIGGTDRHPLATALPIPGAARLLEPAVQRLAESGPVWSPVARQVLRWRHTPAILPRLGVMARQTPQLADVIGHFSQLNFGNLMQLTAAAHRHSAADVLPHVRQPTLIVHGDRDTLTPLRVAKRLNQGIHGSTLHVVSGGTHYALLEFPDQVGPRIGDFLSALT